MKKENKYFSRTHQTPFLGRLWTLPIDSVRHTWKKNLQIYNLIIFYISLKKTVKTLFISILSSKLNADTSYITNLLL